MIGEETAYLAADEGREEAQNREDGGSSVGGAFRGGGVTRSSTQRGLGFGVRVQERCERRGAGTK